MSVVMRAKGDASALMKPLAGIVAEMDPAVPLMSARGGSS
jgi:hypothetical protein